MTPCPRGNCTRYGTCPAGSCRDVEVAYNLSLPWEQWRALWAYLAAVGTFEGAGD